MRVLELFTECVLSNPWFIGLLVLNMGTVLVLKGVRVRTKGVTKGVFKRSVNSDKRSELKK